MSSRKKTADPPPKKVVPLDLFAQDARGPLDGDALPTDGSAKKLAEACIRAWELDTKIAAASEALKKLSEEKNLLMMRELPQLFDEAQTDSFGLPNALAPGEGADVVVQTYLKASIPTDADDDFRDAAFKHLEELEAGYLIRQFVEVSLPQGRPALTRDFVRMINTWLAKKRPKKILPDDWATVNVKTAVHHASLTSWAKAQIEKDAALPHGSNQPRLNLKLIGGDQGRVCKIVPRKKKKK